jgi:hypothetical protein
MSRITGSLTRKTKPLNQLPECTASHRYTPTDPSQAPRIQLYANTGPVTVSRMIIILPKINKVRLSNSSIDQPCNNMREQNIRR